MNPSVIDIPFGDLKRQYLSIKKEVDCDLIRSAESGWYILGESGKKFEGEFSNFCGSRYAVGVASGTDALLLSLLALGIGRGDEVITVPNTAIPTVAAIFQAGATPVFVDIKPENYCMDPARIEEKITSRTRAIMPVHLYGHPADMEAIKEIAERRGLKVVEDACQAHGAMVGSSHVGTFGESGCFSFYPSKNLGAMGDGGMVITNKKELYDKLISLRNYGYLKKNVWIDKGINSRLDEVQASILSLKLKYLKKWNRRRREIAANYLGELPEERYGLPYAGINIEHNYHLFVIRHEKREQLQSYLLANGVGTEIHYPTPLYLQRPLANSKIKRGECPVSERLSQEILSIPLYPELTDGEVETIINLLKKFVP